MKFVETKKDNKIIAIKSARSSIRLEEPEEEQMEGVLDKRGTEPMKDMLRAAREKPPRMKPLPLVAIHNDQEAASKLQEC